jgi:hypothetical protein
MSLTGAPSGPTIQARTRPPGRSVRVTGSPPGVAPVRIAKPALSDPHTSVYGLASILDPASHVEPGLHLEADVGEAARAITPAT